MAWVIDDKSKCENFGMHNLKTKECRKPKVTVFSHAESIDSAEEYHICKEVTHRKIEPLGNHLSNCLQFMNFSVQDWAEHIKNL